MTVLLVAALAIPPGALAHANLLRSNPTDGAVVKSPPRALRLVFDDAVRAEPGIKAVRNDGASVLGGRPHVVGQRELLVPLQAHLPDGDYTILWRGLTDDGHSIAGVIAFAVGTGRAPPHAALTAPSGQPPLQIWRGGCSWPAF